MPHKKMNSKIFNQNRDGITLLFVISMVVLFLLMGTTFMIVSNDFFKEARRRSRRSTNVVNPSALLDRCFYDLFRGPDLRDIESPLRGQSILADQYGYGIVGRLEQVFREGTDNPLVQLRLSVDGQFTRRQFDNFGDPDSGPFWNMLTPIKERFFAGRLNGQVISIIDSAPDANVDFDGFSGRIISCAYDNPADPTQLIVHVLPNEILNPPEGAVTSDNDKMNALTALMAQDAAGMDVFSTVIINGRDFSGIGSGDLAVNPYGPPGATTEGTLSATFRFDVDAAATNYLGPQSLAPNRFGESFDALVGDPTDYLARPNSPNEPYDAPDEQNMFLSATLPGNGMVIPSFGRDGLYTSQFVAGTTTASQARRFSFRAIRLTEGAEVDFADTANEDFEHLESFEADGTLMATAVNMAASLDVDSDGDGTLDAIWIDIGLPTQTDVEGRSFKPLVAYRVLDLDNRLNLNAHGNFADAARAAAPTVSLGSGYGVAEISLRVAGITDVQSAIGNNLTLYNALLEQRYGRDGDQPGYDTTEINGLDADDVFGRNQKLFSYPENPTELQGAAGDGTSFSSTLDLLGEYGIATDVSGFNNELPGFTPVDGDFSTNPYNVSFSINGAPGDDLFTAVELEGLLRANDPDARLISTRLNPLVIEDVESFPALGPGLGDIFTTDSFEVNMPATGRSLPERINDLLPDGLAEPARSNLINNLTPREVIFGGKLNINRYLGNGIDDDNDQIVDEPGEPDVQATTQRGAPSFSTINARQELVRDLYLTFLLATGDTPPANFMFTGESGNANVEYHRMVAQWAVNIVDFRDADSINTPYVFDATPFDGNPLVTAANPALTVWGCERPEILISETFAFHDRQNVDGSTADTVDDGDDDWDSVAVPISGALIEFYNPQLHPDDFQSIGEELGGPNAVDLGATTPGGGDPVWRVGLKRLRSEDDNDILRTIFFVDPGENSSAEIRMGDSFYPSSAVGGLEPGEYALMQPAAINNLVLGVGATVDGVGGADVRILLNSSRDAAGAGVPGRTLSISDRDGGYDINATPVPSDRPLDATNVTANSYRNQADLEAVWSYGITDNFRYLYLQRLADPSLDFNAATNPYLTVDTAGIDLLATNSAAVPTRTNMGAGPVNMLEEVGVSLNGTQIRGMNRFTEYRSVERGSSYISPTAAETTVEPTPETISLARRNLFRADDGPTVPATGFNGALGFEHSFGLPNASHDESGVAIADRTPLGWLPWNNRPFASHMELLNVPYVSPGLLTFLVNTPAAGGGGGGNSGPEEFRDQVAANYGNTQFQHLLRFSGALGTTPATANRFAHFFEFVETPSLFLGTETFLPGNVALINNSLNLQGNAIAEFHPRVHGIPNFRTPGKININTISPLQAQVWTNLTAGFNMPLNGFLTGRNGPANDFSNLYTTAENASFVADNARTGGQATLLNDDPNQSPPFNSLSNTDTVNSPQLKKDAGSSYFANEFKQKMGNMVTTRSSVFAIWITVGYFEVDQFGRLGAELATESGEVSRNRGFYIVDRSIPVAFEPGKNHNVDNAVLVRSIIE